jgi:hypothetical protein
MNQREFTRVRTRIPVDIDHAGGRIEGSTQDISLNGMFVATDATLAANTPCQAVLHIDGRGGAIVIRANGAVIRTLSGGIALHFNELVELDSYEHLRNLILYNASDPAQAEQEFDSHLGLKRVDPAGPPPG